MYYVEGSNPAIISKELFDQAVQLRKQRRHEGKQGQGRPFAKKLVCGTCGNLLRFKKVNGIWYWVCRTHEEQLNRCGLLPIQETQIIGAFQRLYYNLKNHPEVLGGLLKNLTSARNRQMLWGEDIVSRNKEISDLISQSYKLTTMNRRGLVDPDIFIIKSDQLAEQLRKAKQEKERLQKQNENDFTESTQQIDVFSAVAEKRQKKAPAVQKTEAQVALQRKCGGTVTPYIEQEVLYLLNRLAGHPERICVPEPPKPASPRLELLEKELTGLLEQLPVDEDAARAKMMELAAVMYEAIDSREYETYRMRRVFELEQPRSELDKDLIVKNISAVLVDSNGTVKIKLKNEQIIERRNRT